MSAYKIQGFHNYIGIKPHTTTLSYVPLKNARNGTWKSVAYNIIPTHWYGKVK